LLVFPFSDSCNMPRKRSAPPGHNPPAKRTTQRHRDQTKRYSTHPDPTSTSEKKVPKQAVKKDNVRVVKASMLGRWAKDCPPAVRGVLVDLLEKYVFTVSQMMVYGSLVANEAILMYLRRGELPPTTQTFFRQCMTGESADPVITSVLSNEFQGHPEIVRYPGDWQTITHAAVKYSANYDNHLWMHFDKRLKGYVYDWIQVCPSISETTIAPIIIAKILGRPCRTPTVLQREVWDFIDEERRELGYPNNFYAESTESSLLLKFAFRALEFKRRHELSGGFSIAPVHRVRRHHITVDTTVLFLMFQEVFRQLGEDAPDWIQEPVLLGKAAVKEYQESMWKRVLDTSKLSRHKFHHSVITDGVQASFIFDCPKTFSTNNFNASEVLASVPAGEILRIISIDPGRTNIITAYDSLHDTFYTLSRRGYYGSISKCRKKLDFWENQLRGVNAELSAFSLRTSNEEQCRGYRRVYFKQYNRMWSVRFHKRVSKEHLRIYSVKRSVLDKFFFSFLKRGGPRPVVAYGASAVQSHGRGELSVPVKRVLKKCQQRYTTVMVNEFLTTKCHSTCGSRMHPVRNNGSLPTVRGLMFCSECKIFVNRDRDACKSIHHVASQPDRPLYLRFDRPFEYKRPLTLLPARLQKETIIS